MKTSGQKTTLGFHDHYVIDGGKARIILHALVTPADVMENTPMLPLLRRVMFRWRVKPKRVIGDTTYGTAENIRAIEESGIHAYTPLADWDRRAEYFGPSQFTYDAERDIYVCPQGETLRLRKAKYTEGKFVYSADAAVFNACPMKAAYTPSDHGWIEPLFGEAKQWHGMRQFRLRVLQKVNMEGLFIAAGQNLKRLLSTQGWGRRPWPDGAAGFADMSPQTCITPT